MAKSKNNFGYTWTFRFANCIQDHTMFIPVNYVMTKRYNGTLASWVLGLNLSAN